MDLLLYGMAGIALGLWAGGGCAGRSIEATPMQVPEADYSNMNLEWVGTAEIPTHVIGGLSSHDATAISSAIKRLR
jgi:hypothetical protein